MHKQYTHGLAFGAEYQWTRVLGTENLEDPSGPASAGLLRPRRRYHSASASAQLLLYAADRQGPCRFSATPAMSPTKSSAAGRSPGSSMHQNGQPFSVSYLGSRQSHRSGERPRQSVGNALPRAAPSPQSHPHRARWEHENAHAWFNPCAFTTPSNYVSDGVTYATYGTSGYDMLRGTALPGLGYEPAEKHPLARSLQSAVTGRLLQHLQPSELRHAEREHFQLKQSALSPESPARQATSSARWSSRLKFNF